MKILRTPDEWERGMRGLPMDETALFVMPDSAPWPITMQGMDYALDIYWLSEGGMILEHASLFPGTSIYWPDHPAKYILEMPIQDEPRYRVGQFLEVPP